MARKRKPHHLIVDWSVEKGPTLSVSDEEDCGISNLLGTAMIDVYCGDLRFDDPFFTIGPWGEVDKEPEMFSIEFCPVCGAAILGAGQITAPYKREDAETAWWAYCDRLGIDNETRSQGGFSEIGDYFGSDWEGVAYAGRRLS